SISLTTAYYAATDLDYEPHSRSLYMACRKTVSSAVSQLIRCTLDRSDWSCSDEVVFEVQGTVTSLVADSDRGWVYASAGDRILRCDFLLQICEPWNSLEGAQRMGLDLQNHRLLYSVSGGGPIRTMSLDDPGFPD